MVGNGIDIARFQPVDRIAARARFGLPGGAKVLILVGGLVERNMHRVIEALPALLNFTTSSSAAPAGRRQPHRNAAPSGAAGLADRVHFLGALPSDEIKMAVVGIRCLALADGNEGWANV